MAETLFPHLKWEQLWAATLETLYMTALSGVATFVLGIVLGLALFLTARGGLFHNRAVYSVISIVVNVFRSIPFIILIVLLIPFTKTLVGTILGANAALPALIVGAAPFYARLVEIALREVDKGVIGGHALNGRTTEHPGVSGFTAGVITCTGIRYYGNADCAGELQRHGGGDWRRRFGKSGLSGRIPAQPWRRHAGGDGDHSDHRFHYPVLRRRPDLTVR